VSFIQGYTMALWTLLIVLSISTTGKMDDISRGKKVFAFVFIHVILGVPFSYILGWWK